MAIRWAIGTAKAGDVVVIAGKGHEDYQVCCNPALSDFGGYGYSYTKTWLDKNTLKRTTRARSITICIKAAASLFLGCSPTKFERGFRKP